jgi:transcriptional antiterminator NusG
LKKVYPGYVLVKMIKNDYSWYLVRNTRGVTGFVGPEPKDPVPLTDDEIRKMGVEQFEPIVDYVVGDPVKVISGPLEGFIGVVDEINNEKKKVRVLVSMFGRETAVEFDLLQVGRSYN